MSDYILIADDNSGIRSLLTEILRSFGYKVQIVTNGLDALNLIHKDEPLLVLMDVKMPGLDGVEVLKSLRPSHPDLPVILISGYSQDNTIQSAISEGLAQEFLPKPFDINEIGIKIERLLKSNPHPLIHKFL